MANLLEGLITREDISSIAATEGLVFDDEDRISILEAMQTIDVQACPGSGKTTLIAAKLILLAKKWPLQYQGVCVLSHTNVAKDEIIDRLKQSKIIEARRLLSYPHFIGTIQDFIHRYIALPYIRSNGISDITVDNDEYVKIARKLLELNQFIWLRGTLNGLGNDDALESFIRMTFRYIVGDNTEINISRRPRAWQQPNNFQRAQQALGQLKQYLDQRGFFLYRDMYTYAHLACGSNEQLSKSIAKRFPQVFIDEMQDTQVHQDEILCDIFPLSEPGLIVQRFGDPDQAIFHGTGSEEPNESFNGKSSDDMNFLIHKSHRFDNVLASKIKALSHNEIPLETELSKDALEERLAVNSRGDTFKHSVIVFSDATRNGVIHSFANIVSGQFDIDYKRSNKFTAKVVGAVGNEIDPTAIQLKIGHYWVDYDKTKSKTNFKEVSLIEAVRYCRQSKSVDWADSYNLLSRCILKLLRMIDFKDQEGRYFSATTLRKHLEENGKWKQFRETTHLLLDDGCQIDHESWSDICNLLEAIFNYQNIPDEASDYLSFSEEEAHEEIINNERDQDEISLTSLPDNKIMHSDGFCIELSTIHGVKGETHDATLIVATKNHRNDLEIMLPFFIGELPAEGHRNADLRLKPHHSANPSQNKQFLRQLYVAASRPRYLLCLAIHEDNITEAQQEALEQFGWDVIQVVDGGDYE